MLFRSLPSSTLIQLWESFFSHFSNISVDALNDDFIFRNFFSFVHSQIMIVVEALILYQNSKLKIERLRTKESL